MKKRLTVLIVFALFLAACTGRVADSKTVVPAATTPTTTPTAIPSPPTVTPTFVSGFADIPPGKYLFVEYWEERDGQESVAGQCQFAAIDFSTYQYNEKTRQLRGSFNWKVVTDKNSIRGFFGEGVSLKGRAGFGARSQLYPIESFPYLRRFRIFSVARDGTIVAEIEGHPVFLEPNKGWSGTATYEATPGCRLVTTARFTNFGLLDESQVDLK